MLDAITKILGFLISRPEFFMGFLVGGLVVSVCLVFDFKLWRAPRNAVLQRLGLHFSVETVLDWLLDDEGQNEKRLKAFMDNPKFVYLLEKLPEMFDQGVRAFLDGLANLKIVFRIALPGRDDRGRQHEGQGDDRGANHRAKVGATLHAQTPPSGS